MFTIGEAFKKDRYSFSIYNHNLTMEKLEDAISEMLFDENVLSYLFTGISKSDKNKNNRILMLRRFIPDEFFYKEREVLDNWNEEYKIIFEAMIKNKGYYSFFAEGLMAYLNLKYLDNKLTFGVISLDETLIDQHTGVDSCMYSNNYIILGEAKFYQDFGSAKGQIIKDFNNNSIINKMRSLYRKTTQSEIFIKDIREIEINIGFDEFVKRKKILSGFILHNQSQTYNYTNITEINQVEFINNYDIVFYHLPIKNKKELVVKIIKKALELIIDETK